MKIRFYNRISYRQARNTIVIVLFLSLSLSSVQIWLDFQKEQEHIDSTISQVIGTVRQSAAFAVYNFDTEMAQNILDGLFEYQSIIQTKIIDDFGTVIGFKERRPKQRSRKYVISDLFVAPKKSYRFPLFLDGKDNLLGYILVTADFRMTAINFIDRANVIILGNIAINIIFACILVLLFYSSINRPLLRIVKALSAVDPKNPGNHRLQIPASHDKDEFGLLIRSVNFLLEGFQNSLDSFREADLKVRASEERFRQMADHIQEAFWLYDWNERRLIYLSPAYEQIWGVPIHKVCENPNIWMQSVYPPDREYARSKFENIVTTGGGEIREYRIVRPDGKVRWISDRGFAIRDGDGKVIRIAGIAEDITDRKKAERILVDSEEYHRRLFDDSPMARIIENFSSVAAEVKVLRENGVQDLETYLTDNPTVVDSLVQSITIERVNQAAIDLFQGDSFPELIAGNYLNWIPDNRWAFIDQVIAFIDHNHWYEGQCRKNSLTGKPLDLIFRKTIVHRQRNDLSRVLVALTDVTEIKRAHREKKKLETQLLQAQKMEAIGTLAGGIAHDFNNLLMGIQGRTSLMLLKMESGHRFYDHLQSIESYVKSASGLTKQLLGFARRGKYDVKPTNLNELVSQTSHMFSRTRKEIQIALDLERGLWLVAADSVQIEQVLLNILVNAWQAMPSGGAIDITTRNQMVDLENEASIGVASGRYAKVSITDTGIGMDSDTQKRIFDPFFTTKEMGRGTGLGLASAYGIVNNHGGVINVHSVKGQGSTFTILLPAINANQMAKVKEMDDLVLGAGETILLVDDEDIIVDVSEPMLVTLNYQVIVARSGDEAVRLFKSNTNRIDLVILDMIMPNMSGEETFMMLKQIKPEIKVLLSSGYSLDGTASKMMAQGCRGFIQKPFNIMELACKVKEIIGL